MKDLTKTQKRIVEYLQTSANIYIKTRTLKGFKVRIYDEEGPVMTMNTKTFQSLLKKGYFSDPVRVDNIFRYYLKLTSENWAKSYNRVIIDPDGWDRGSRFNYEWYEERITKREFLLRAMRSTTRPKPSTQSV